MLLIRLALRNLLRHPVKTALISAFIVIGSALVFVADSVFESTETGMEKSLVGSLTGHFAVAAPADEAYGLFGNEIPIVGEYEGIEAIADFDAVASTLRDLPAVTAWTPLVSTPSHANIAGYGTPAAVFGIDPASYFEVCPDVELLWGDVSALSAGGVFLNERMAAAAEKSLGRPLAEGDAITFSLAAGGSFRLRTGTLAGVVRYPAPSEILDRIILADPVTVRALAGYTLGYAVGNSEADDGVDQGGDLGDLDALFMGADDFVSDDAGGLTLAGVERDMADTEKRDELVRTDSAAWSFVLAKGADLPSGAAAGREARRRFTAAGTDVRVMGWHTAAGTGAVALLAIRTIFNIGVSVLVFGSVLVVMNALVISVLERTAEIGSMRALGASKAFIRRLFILETALLTVLSSLLGIALGAAAAGILALRGIPIANPLLAALFGGDRLRPALGWALAAKHMAGAAVIGALAWLYPVMLALRVPPVAAMADHE